MGNTVAILVPATVREWKKLLQSLWDQYAIEISKECGSYTKELRAVDILIFNVIIYELW